MFNSEEILFGNNNKFTLLNKRCNIKKSTMPSISDGLTLYIFGLLLIIYIGRLVQLKFGEYGIAIIQIMIISVPLIFGWYIKSNFKDLFNINIPKILDVLGE